MEGKRLPQQVLQYAPPGETDVGRPRKKWLENSGPEQVMSEWRRRRILMEYQYGVGEGRLCATVWERENCVVCVRACGRERENERVRFLSLSTTISYTLTSGRCHQYLPVHLLSTHFLTCVIQCLIIIKSAKIVCYRKWTVTSKPREEDDMSLSLSIMM